MARRPRRLNLSVDDRTEAMSDEALLCRSLGHKWALKGISRRRFNELLEQGLAEYSRYCEHGCGSTWRQLWRIEDGEVLENERKYPSGGEYLAPANSGRIKRPQARIAQFARTYSAFT